jgi:hypothetical protein
MAEVLRIGNKGVDFGAAGGGTRARPHPRPFPRWGKGASSFTGTVGTDSGGDKLAAGAKSEASVALQRPVMLRHRLCLRRPHPPLRCECGQGREARRYKSLVPFLSFADFACIGCTARFASTPARRRVVKIFLRLSSFVFRPWSALTRGWSRLRAWSERGG